MAFVIVAGAGGVQAPSLGMQEDGSLGRGRGARDQWDTRSGGIGAATGEGARKLDNRRAADWSTEKRIIVLRGKHLGVAKRFWMGRRATMRKNNKSQTEAHDNVWSLNLETEKKLRRRWLVSTNASSSQTVNLCESDKKFDAEFMDMEALMRMALEAQLVGEYCHDRCVIRVAEIELNEGLARIHQVVAAMATATSSMCQSARGIAWTTGTSTCRNRWTPGEDPKRRGEWGRL